MIMRHDSRILRQVCIHTQPVRRSPCQYLHRYSTSLPATPQKGRQNCIINGDLSNVKHWFAVSLPEGTCVGFTTDSNHQSWNTGTSKKLSPHLHKEEYDWGQDNITSAMARTSFYLGRIALRTSLQDMMCSNDAQTIQFWEQIKSNPIRKDNFGRPILPNIVVGSISHKGEYAVGLSRLRFDDVSCSTLGNDCMNLKWREECRIFPEEDGDSDDSSLDADQVVGIGVDIERIHDKRSEKIQRKVLTKKEQQELGGLEVHSSFLFILLSSISIEASNFFIDLYSRLVFQSSKK